MEVLFREIGIYASRGRSTSLGPKVVAFVQPRSPTAAAERKAHRGGVGWASFSASARRTPCTRGRSLLHLLSCSATSARRFHVGIRVTRAARFLLDPPRGARRQRRGSTSTRTADHLASVRDSKVMAYDPGFAYEVDVSSVSLNACTRTSKTSSTTSPCTTRLPMPAMPAGVEDGIVRG